METESKLKSVHLGQETQLFTVVAGGANQGLALFARDANPVTKAGNGFGMKGDRLTPQLIKFGGAHHVTNQQNNRCKHSVFSQTA